MLLSFPYLSEKSRGQSRIGGSKSTVQHRFFSFIRRKNCLRLAPVAWLACPPLPFLPPPLPLSFRVNNRSLLLLLFFPLSRASPRSPLHQRIRERPADKLPSPPSEPFSSSVSSQVPSFFFFPHFRVSSVSLSFSFARS